MSVEFENDWITSFKGYLSRGREALMKGDYAGTLGQMWALANNLNPRDPEADSLIAEMEAYRARPNKECAWKAYDKMRDHVIAMGYLLPQSYELIGQIRPEDLTLGKGR